MVADVLCCKVHKLYLPLKYTLLSSLISLWCHYHRDRPRDLKQFLIKFLYLQELLQPNAWPSQEQLATLCQTVVHDFSLCMYHTGTHRRTMPLPKATATLPRVGDTLKESTISDDLVFKIFVMMLMTIYKLQKKGNVVLISLAAIIVSFPVCISSNKWF